MTKLGTLLKEKRISLGLRLITVASVIEMGTPQSLHGIESGKRRCPKKYIDKLSKILKINKKEIIKAYLKDVI